MNKKMFFVVAILCMLLSSVCFADPKSVSELQSSFNSADGNSISENVDSKAGNITVTVLDIIQIVGTFLGVVLLIIFGIRWMMANSAQKAKLQQEVWNYIFGIVFLIGAGPIAQLVYETVTKLK